MKAEIEGEFTVVPDGRGVALTELAESLGYDGELSVGALMVEIGVYRRRTAEDCLVLGQRFLLLKEITKHGEFTKCIKRTGIHERTARRFMRAAEKILTKRTMSALNEKITSDILEFVIEDNDEPENTVEMDEIDCMPPSVVRQSLREIKSKNIDEISPEKLAANPLVLRLKEEIEARDATIENQGKNFDTLRNERDSLQYQVNTLTRTQVPGDGEFDARTFEVRQEAAALEYGARICMDDLETLFEQVLNEEADPHMQELRMRSVALAAGGALALAQALFEAVRRSMGDGMPVQPHGDLILSPEEKLRLDSGLTIIRENHKRAKAERVDEATRQAAAHQKGPGRRKGSKNKKGDGA